MANLNNDFFLGFEMGEEEGDGGNATRPPSRKKRRNGRSLNVCGRSRNMKGKKRVGSQNQK